MRILAFSIFFLLIVSLTKSVKCDENIKFEELARIIRPHVDENTQQKAAMSVIRRLVQEKADKVSIKVNFKLPLNYFKVGTNLHFK
jgi:hypothetical protein